MLRVSGAVVGISIAILIVLFSVQRFGTDKVGFTFAPVVLVWFSFIGGIGLYNLFKYDIGVLRAFNPKYIVDYMKRNGKDGWISLGGIFLCITGECWHIKCPVSSFFMFFIFIHLKFSIFDLVAELIFTKSKILKLRWYQSLS